MLKTLKITSVNPVPNTETGKTSYAIGLNFEGRALSLWRTENQFKADIKRSGLNDDLSALDYSSIVGGTVEGEFLNVKAGDKYTVDIEQEDGSIVAEEREYKAEGIQVTDGFLSFQRNMMSTIAAEMAADLRRTLNM